MISWYVVASKKLWRTQISLVCKHLWTAELNMYFPFLCFHSKGEGTILDWHGAWVSTPQVWCSSLHGRGLCSQQTPSQSYSLGTDSSRSCSPFLAKLYLCWIVWRNVILKEIQYQLDVWNHCIAIRKRHFIVELMQFWLTNYGPNLPVWCTE